MPTTRLREWLALGAFTLCCTAAFGQQAGKTTEHLFGPGFLRTLLKPAVQQELGLSDEQRAKLAQLDDRMRAAAKVAYSLPPAERSAKTRAQFDNAQNALVTILNDAQITRFKQILWQQSYGAALGHPEIAAALGITDEQSNQVRQMLRNELEQSQNESAGLDRKALRHKIQQLHAAGTRKALEILTPAQREKWRELMGKPFIATPDE